MKNLQKFTVELINRVTLEIVENHVYTRTLQEIHDAPLSVKIQKEKKNKWNFQSCRERT